LCHGNKNYEGERISKVHKFQDKPWQKHA
jgi:hypothetical protein